MVLVAMCLTISTTQAVEIEDESRLCGVYALAFLLDFEDRTTEFQTLKDALPSPGTAGHSLLELRSAALRFGSRLEGVRLDRTERSLNRPMILHLERRSRGHFVTVIPVGHTGNLVQVLDPVEMPRVMDKDEFLSQYGWSGFALRSSRSWIPTNAFGGLFIGLSIITWKVLRSSRSGSTSSH